MLFYFSILIQISLLIEGALKILNIRNVLNQTGKFNEVRSILIVISNFFFVILLSSVYVQRTVTTWNWRKARTFEEKFRNTHHEWRQSCESRLYIAENSSYSSLSTLSLLFPSLSPFSPINSPQQKKNNKTASQDLVAEILHSKIFLCVGQENWTKACLLQCGRKFTCITIISHKSKEKWIRTLKLTVSLLTEG